MALELTQQLVRLGIETHICCIESHGRLASEVTTRGLRVISLNKGLGFSFSTISALNKLIKGGGYTIVHTHNPLAHFYGTVAAASVMGCGVIHTKHQMRRQQSWRQLLLSRIATRLSQFIVGVSAMVTDSALGELKVKPSKVCTIENGLDLTKYVSLEMPDYHSESEVVIGTVGRLCEIKNQELLIDAFWQVQKKHPKCRLHLVGDGEMRTTLERKVADMHLERKVTFIGYCDNVAGALNDIDVFVLSSRSEGMPLVIIEAMAAARPIVSTSVGGIPSMIEHRQSGLLTVPENINDLAEAISWMVENPAAAVLLGRQARIVATKRFSVDRMVKRYLELYAAVSEEDVNIPFNVSHNIAESPIENSKLESSAKSEGKITQ
jgi:glycosyltransferase involved in cell wall biosynthesis